VAGLLPGLGAIHGSHWFPTTLGFCIQRQPLSLIQVSPQPSTWLLDLLAPGATLPAGAAAEVRQRTLQRDWHALLSYPPVSKEFPTLHPFSPQPGKWEWRTELVLPLSEGSTTGPGLPICQFHVLVVDMFEVINKNSNVNSHPVQTLY
jgi:hypothetical protein